MGKLLVYPATRYPIREHIATSIAYGIWVATWSIWLHAAPVDDSIVVSDMGEQWSPKIDPARVADRLIIKCSGATCWQMTTIIGINIPKVPHEVPIENDKIAATINIITGIRATGIWDDATSWLTYGPVDKTVQTPLIAHAKVKITHAVTIDFIPKTTPSIYDLKERVFLDTNKINATISAPKPPMTRDFVASVLPNPSNRVIWLPALK